MRRPSHAFRSVAPCGCMWQRRRARAMLPTRSRSQPLTFATSNRRWVSTHHPLDSGVYVHDPTSCIQPRDPDESLWRIMDLAKFEWLVTKSALYFRRADRFEDPLEGTLPTANRAVPRFWGFVVDPASPGSDEIFDRKERIWAQFRRWNYVNCWYRGASPSASMWHRYGAHGTGVAIRSSFARIALALNRTGRSVRITEVEYFDPHELAVSERNLAAARRRKSREYCIEEEVRLTTSLMPTGPKAPFWQEPKRDGLAVPITLPHLIAGIAIGPNAAKSVVDHVKLLVPWTGLVCEWHDADQVTPSV